ncbi:hypothetical protein LPB03_03270 [Polaribacter vadi]|uniref:Uncharacterized protein n=1 Tax=Polaribacter vadi TaxID=1774273 RepID=A0A1B8TYH5_9FLAO|nr:hypothetical protein [Polaribacter vadi]AOW16546.1 hypothetical protein LPB03_03270 [Polaribacter vadi]OBY64549.1 hypothetical protein LPB3_09225 [Polaribacter vadi]
MKVTFENFEDGHKKHYHKNFDIAERSKKISYFNEDNDTIIHIETPVVSEDFHVKKVFNISTKHYKAIVIHISDKSINPSRDSDKNKIMKIDFNFDEIDDTNGAEALNIEKKDNIYVVVFNDNDEMTTSYINDKVFIILKDIMVSNLKFKEKAIRKDNGKKNLDFLFVDPLEGGGGVIVRNP